MSRFTVGTHIEVVRGPYVGEMGTIVAKPSGPLSLWRVALDREKQSGVVVPIVAFYDREMRAFPPEREANETQSGDPRCPMPKTDYR